MSIRRLPSIAAVASLVPLFLAPAPPAAPAQTGAPTHAGAVFKSSSNCLACHNGLTTPSGEDVSIGAAWRASMMANSSRDPYWQASVRREAIDHPSLGHEIEDECSICHMPMARTLAVAAGRAGEIFTHLPIGRDASEESRLAADGVSCTMCHQIGSERLGTRESFTGGFVVNAVGATAPPAMFGPFEIDAGRTAVMRSATGMRPAESSHFRQSELCATCHTLYTQARDAQGRVTATLPEQVPYLEWRHSAFRDEQSCQACHMRAVDRPVPISSVLGEPREGLGRHTFLGGNAFMLRMLNRFRRELGVEALPSELDAAAEATVRQLQSDTATVSIVSAPLVAGRLTVEAAISNRAGHKLPTGYPARRAWLHLTVRDAAGRAVFESGAVMPSGAIQGNDNDADASRYEPHYREIRSAEQVQIYESVMSDANGAVTTGLLRGTAFLKDNRLLPRGFDKATAEPDIAVRGPAADDDDFIAGGDRVRYAIDVAGRPGPFQIDLELMFQTIAFRWAENLRAYEADETRRFASFYDAMSDASSIVLASATARVSESAR